MHAPKPDELHICETDAPTDTNAECFAQANNRRETKRVGDRDWRLEFEPRNLRHDGRYYKW